MKPNIVAIVALVVSSWASSVSAAEVEPIEGYAFVAAEAWVTPEVSGHGVFFLGARFNDLPRDATLELQLNTDTLRAGVAGFELGGGWSAGLEAHGQYRFAALATDYYRSGELIESLGFSASRIGGSAHLSVEPETDLYVRLEASADRWYFSRLEGTAESLPLPAKTWIVSPRMSVTYWGFEHDPSHRELHRPFWRTTGLGMGAVFGLDHRTEAQTWGPVGGRYDPVEFSARASQWIRWGVRLGSAMRLELFEEAGIETGGDALTARPVGGMNPYVAMVPGAPWAAFMPSRWAQAGTRLRFSPIDSMEVGPVLAAAYVDDPGRLTDDDDAVVAGLGAELDWRPGGQWQVDANLGFSPDTGAWTSGPHISLWAGVGRQF